jgi:hypothetical protein
MASKIRILVVCIMGTGAYILLDLMYRMVP